MESSDELKTKVLEKIQNTSDQHILQQVGRLLAINEWEQDPYILIKDERDAVERGLQDVVEGRVFSQAEAKSLLYQWKKK